MDENKKAARNKKISHAVMMIVLAVLLFIFIFPFLLVVINVFKTKADITSNPLALIGAHGFTLANFPEAMKKMNFTTVFGNSLLVTSVSTVLTLTPTSCARRRFEGSLSPGASVPLRIAAAK
jgi:raffinose/stachyose/melibiose transport system permease protein